MFNLFLLADDTVMFWGQTFARADLIAILMLVLLEGLLSIDNALVLGLLAKRVPKPLQKRALTYGLVGAFVFRVIAVCTASYLMRWNIVKLMGGGYLVYIAVKHLFFESQEDVAEEVKIDADGSPVILDARTGAELTLDQQMTEIKERVPVPVPEEQLRAGRSFWMTVVVIELTDIAFAVDSILAAMAFVGDHPEGHQASTFHPKLWVVIAGGVIGIMLMRVAATMFIRLLEKFPRFELAAYLLVIVIGLKLLGDWGFDSLDFHSPQRPEFWVFWMTMLAALAVGFMPARNSKFEPQS